MDAKNANVPCSHCGHLFKEHTIFGCVHVDFAPNGDGIGCPCESPQQRIEDLPKDNPRRFMVFVETIAGPWFSLGFHIDFQAPKIDIHFIWWILSIGWLYMTDGEPALHTKEA